MESGFSKASMLLIEKRNTLLLAENRFLSEWADMLRAVHRYFSSHGSMCRLVGDPPEFLQLSRRRWLTSPNQGNTIHYEILCNRPFLRRGVVDLSLHVEEGVGNQAAVCSRLRGLLHPYAANLQQLLSPYTPSMPDLPPPDILKGYIPLALVNTDAMIQALKAMMQTESFVDEAMFLAGTRTVWGTDFEVSAPRIHPNWFGKDSGQQVVHQVGRCGSPAWRMDGSAPNARGEHGEQGVFCVLVANDAKHLISNLRRYRISAVVKSCKKAHLYIWGEGHAHAADGHTMAWPCAFRADQEFFAPESSDVWHCVNWKVSVPPVEGVNGRFAKEDGGGNRSIPFDFAKDGVWIVLNVQTDDDNLLFDSIEIAECEE